MRRDVEVDVVVVVKDYDVVSKVVESIDKFGVTKMMGLRL